MSFDLLWDIMRAYVTDGLLFAFGHLLLLAFIFYDVAFGSLRQEILALRSWDPEDPDAVSPEGAESTIILDRFISECEALAPQGFFVPLTDFSDRLDSTVEGLLTNLYNRVNMLLIVGIAGTLFGIFEFAVRGSLELQDLSNESLGALGTVLSQSMAKAFPVGFAGLVLMMVCQLLVPLPERRLRGAVSQALGLAVSKRQELSKSQAKVVEEAAEAIERAMQPLENLEITLSNTITPVIDAFREELQGSHELFETQFKELTGATGQIGDAVKGVEHNVKVLQNASERLDETLKTAPEALEATMRMQQEQAEALTLFRETNEEAQKTLRDSIASFGRQLDSLAASYQQAFGDIKADLAASVEASISEISDKASLLYDDISTQVSGFVRSTEEQLVTSAGHLQDVVESADSALQKFKEFPNDLRQDIAGVFEGIQDRVLSVARSSITDINQSVNAHVANLRKLLEARLEEDRAVIQQLDETIPQLTTAMESFVRNSEDTVGRLATEVGDKWHKVSDNFRANIEASTVSLERLRELPEAAEAEITDTLRILQTEARQVVNETWKQFVTAAQESLLPRLDGLDEDAASVRQELEQAARAWQTASQSAVVAIRDPIEETVSNANREIQNILAKLNQALVQRYPEVIRDAERFTARLSEMTDRIEQVGRSFETTMAEAQRVQGEVRKIPEMASDGLFDAVAKVMEKGETLRVERRRAVSEGAEPPNSDGRPAWLKRIFPFFSGRGESS